MRQFAVGEARLKPVELDSEVLSGLLETRSMIHSRTLLLWGEHCSECAMPLCYSTCALYTPRADFKCRRFRRGIESQIAVAADGRRIPLMSVEFRRWGKLEAQGGVRLVGSGAARALEIADPVVGVLCDLPLLPLALRRKGARAGDLARQVAASRLAGDDAPDLFILEAINQGGQVAGVTLTIKSDLAGASALFQTRVSLHPGYNRVCVPAASILNMIGRQGTFLYQVEPVELLDDAAPVLFGILEFVRLRPGAVLADAGAPTLSVGAVMAAAGGSTDVVVANAAPARSSPAAKCVVWDLDNTVWSGTLVEDGPDGIRLNAAAAALIVELDRRGILNSVASKNSADAAEAALRRFGLWDYFLFPQIGWGPKSQSVGAIAKLLNIGVDSLVLIDDQIFERAEVQHGYPEVETFDIDVMESLGRHPRFDVPVTEESRQRRSMYQVEQARMTILEQTGGDYTAFLNSCRISLEIRELDAASLNRAFELTERTNQLNYSGRRLSRRELEATIGADDRMALLLSVGDRFGEYGIVGLAMMDLPTWTVECFFMSCRVQRKKVDHAFFGRLLALGRTRGHARLSIVYLPTAKNEPSRVVLEDEMGFTGVEGPDGGRIFQVATDSLVPDADIVTISDLSRLGAAPVLTAA